MPGRSHGSGQAGVGRKMRACNNILKNLYTKHQIHTLRLLVCLPDHDVRSLLVSLLLLSHKLHVPFRQFPAVPYPLSHTQFPIPNSKCPLSPPPLAPQLPPAYNLVHNRTNPSAPTKSPSLTNLAKSKFNGLSASPPAASNCCTASSELTRPYAGVHEVFRRSRQISPVLKEMFGCAMGVLKVIEGGWLG